MRRTATNIRNTYGGYRPRHIDTDVEQGERDAAAGAALASVTPGRIAHPVIAEPRWTSPFRVLRRFQTLDGMQLEIIGETNTLSEALAITSREQWAAIVTDKNGKQVSFNWQPEERRA